MPTNKPRVLVTLDDDLFRELKNYMDEQEYCSLSATVRSIVNIFLWEHKNVELHGDSFFLRSDLFDNDLL